MAMLDNRAAGKDYIKKRIEDVAAMEKIPVRVEWEPVPGTDGSLLKLTSGGKMEQYPIVNPELESQDRIYRDTLAESYLRKFMQDISS